MSYGKPVKKTVKKPAGHVPKNARAASTGHRAPARGKAVPAHRAVVREQSPDINAELRTEIIAIVMFAAALLLFIGIFLNAGGFLSGTLKGFLIGAAGFGAYTLPFVCVLWGVLLLINKERRPSFAAFLKYFGLFLTVITFVHMVNESVRPPNELFGDYVTDVFYSGGASSGGVLGGVIAYFLKNVLGTAGAYIVVIAAFIVLLTVATGKSLINAFVRVILKIDRELTKFNNAGRQLAENDSEDEEYEFEYDPRNTNDYVYETRGKKNASSRSEAVPAVPPKKSSARKVFDYMIDEEEEELDGEPEIYLMGEPSGAILDTPKKPVIKPAVKPAAKTRDESQKILDFKGAGIIPEKPETPVFHEEKPELSLLNIEIEEDYDDTPVSKDALADNALAGLAAIVEPEWESAINVKGVGVEGYVPKAVTTASSGDDFVEAESAPWDEAEHGGLIRGASVSGDEPAPIYELPPIDLLEVNTYVPSHSSKAQFLENSKKLEETLKSFGVEARVVEVCIGPTVTRYELSPGVGVKVSKISSLADDLALNLAALGIRIEAPVPGKSVVGIEIPNTEVQTVFLRDVVDDDAFRAFPSRLGFAVGKDIAGNSVIVDIAKMPHLLIAGATGAGKSVCINTIIASILFRSTPDEVKMLMIDPKVVELNVYNGIPHLEIPVVTDPHKAAGALSWGVREMNDRYNAFAKSGTRDLKGYNETLREAGEKPLPQIVIIIDELADLMMSCKADVEQNICRLAQKARAAGIHLIIATQRPSVDVITGLIKANVPSRLAFAVTSGTDSRTILDMVGAEKLLGKGDMLFSPAGLSKPQRIQGAFISDKEVERLVTCIIDKNGRAEYDEEKIERITASNQGEEEDLGEDADEFMREAIGFVTEKGKASVSMLQRQFRIGYNRAARMMDMLEARGIVGPEDGAKPRKVLIGMRPYEEI